MGSNRKTPPAAHSPALQRTSRHKRRDHPPRSQKRCHAGQHLLRSTRNTTGRSRTPQRPQITPERRLPADPCEPGKSSRKTGKNPGNSVGDQENGGKFEGEGSKNDGARQAFPGSQGEGSRAGQSVNTVIGVDLQRSAKGLRKVSVGFVAMVFLPSAAPPMGQDSRKPARAHLLPDCAKTCLACP